MKRVSKLAVILGALILILSGLCRAEDIELEKIVITPSRIEESSGDVSRRVDVITSRDMENSGAKDLAQILTGLTSVNISNYGGLGATKTMRMRGSTAAQVLVLVDGRPINNPRDGEAELSTIPLENIERVEVMHGPGSSLYGAGAMGGTINIITKKPPKEKQKTEFTTSFGTFRTYIERFSHGAKMANLGYLITSEYQSSEGFRDNSEFSAKNLNPKFEYDFNNNSHLTFNSGFYKSKLGTPGEISSADMDDKQKVLKNFLDLSWIFKPDEITRFFTKIYNNYDRLEFIENTAGSIYDTSLNKDIHTTKVKGIDLQFSKRLFDNFQTVYGFNYITNLNDSTTSAKHRYIVKAGYLEGKVDLLKNLEANFSARFDDYSNFGTELSPNFSFVYKFYDDAKLHGLIARSFRAPTFNDLYWPDQGWTKGNPNLKPEKGTTGEIGMEARLNKYLVSGITYYRSDYNDLINWAEESGVWQPKNVNSAVIDGIEFENKINLTDSLEFNLDYTFLRAKDDKTHKYLIYQPKYKLDSSLKYKDLKGFIFELKGQFTDKRFHDSDNTIKIKRFFILGFSASKKFKQGFTCFASIDNLLNRTYQVIRDYPVPGFSLTGGAKIEF